MLKILEIINLPESAINFIGGQFEYLRNVGGYDMHLICSPGAGIEEFCVKNKVHYQPVLLNRQISVKDDFIALWQICSYIRKNKIDIVIAHQSKGRLLGMVAARICGVKYKIVFAHGIVYETMIGFKRNMMVINDKIISKMADQVICVSNYVIEQRKKDFIDKGEKCVLLGSGSCNGLDTITKFNPDLMLDNEVLAIKNKYDISEGDFVIGFCGRLVKDKGIIELISAFDTFQKKHPTKNIKLLIVGYPEKRDGLPQDILNALLSYKTIICTGKVPYEDIQKYYKVMTVLVLPSHREGFGMVSVEAQAMEVPAIVSGYTGCAETIIDGETGLYIDENPDSIVRALDKCLDEELVLKLGRSGRKFVVENFEHTIIRKKMLILIDSML